MLVSVCSESLSRHEPLPPPTTDLCRREFDHHSACVGATACAWCSVRRHLCPVAFVSRETDSKPFAHSVSRGAVDTEDNRPLPGK